MSKEELIQMQLGKVGSVGQTDDVGFKLLVLTEMIEKCLAELAEVKALVNLVQSGCEMNCNSDCKCGGQI